MNREFYTNYYTYSEFFTDSIVNDYELMYKQLINQHVLDVNPQIISCIRSGNEYVYGYNSRKTHPLQKLYSTSEHKIFLHAEIDSIIKASRRSGFCLNDSEISVYRWKKNGESAVSFPCDGCFRAIKESGIIYIHFFDLSGNPKTLDIGDTYE